MRRREICWRSLEGTAMGGRPPAQCGVETRAAVTGRGSRSREQVREGWALRGVELQQKQRSQYGWCFTEMGNGQEPALQKEEPQAAWWRGRQGGGEETKPKTSNNNNNKKWSPKPSGLFLPSGTNSAVSELTRSGDWKVFLWPRLFPRRAFSVVFDHLEHGPSPPLQGLQRSCQRGTGW